MRPSPIEAVVFDLDGVIRHWNDDELELTEVAAGLAPRTILNIGFSDDLGPACVTGTLTYRQWMDEIRRRVVADHGERAIPALDAWEQNVGIVDPAAVSMLRAVRAHTTVALLSNGSTRLRRDLAVLGISGEFDVIFNTAELGVAKPDVEVFDLVVDRLGVTAANTVFVDDLEANVVGARAAGLRATVHVDVTATIAYLTSHGLALELDLDVAREGAAEALTGPEAGG